MKEQPQRLSRRDFIGLTAAMLGTSLVSASCGPVEKALSFFQKEKASGVTVEKVPSEILATREKLKKMIGFMLSSGNPDLAEATLEYNEASVITGENSIFYIDNPGRWLSPYERDAVMSVGLLGSNNPTQRGWRIRLYPGVFADNDLSVEEAAIIFYANYLILQEARALVGGERSLWGLTDHRARVEAWAWTRTLVNVYGRMGEDVKGPRVEEIYNKYQECQEKANGDPTTFNSCWNRYHELRLLERS